LGGSLGLSRSHGEEAYHFSGVLRGFCARYLQVPLQHCPETKRSRLRTRRLLEGGRLSRDTLVDFPIRRS
jgi:hypothetical protein